MQDKEATLTIADDVAGDAQLWGSRTGTEQDAGGACLPD
jgi:hypothetical protein